MKQLKALVLMQLKDKLDLSFVKDKRQLLIKTILGVVKFAVVTAACYFLVYFCRLYLGLFYSSEAPMLLSFVVTLLFALSVLSCTVGLVQTMYFSEDNKVLVTFPCSQNLVFVSKLLVFYFYELRKAFDLLIPIILGFGIYLFQNSYVGVGYFFKLWIPVLFYAGAPVLLGALLSIPAFYLFRLFKRYPFSGVVCFVLILGVVTYGVVQAIGVIPENINMIEMLGPLQRAIRGFLLDFEDHSLYLTEFVYIILGEPQPNGAYRIAGITFAKFGILVFIEVLLFALVFLITRFFFYKMMQRSFEHSKKQIDKKKVNRRHGKYSTFVIKELRIQLRSINEIISTISVYIAVPVMIYFLNKIFSAINTNVTGDNMANAFNVLIILLPLLASNGVVAKSFSIEGRAGYIKKTKPLNLVFPLVSKLLVNLVLSIPSVLASVIVFNSFNNLPLHNVVLFFFGVLFIHYGHMIWSATLDIMNPQNEQYATTGGTINNKNENVSTIVAFIGSMIFALFSYMLFSESITSYHNLNMAFIKICLIGFAIFVSTLSMFMWKVKAFYYEK